MQQVCLNCGKNLQKGKFSGEFCSHCRAMFRYHNDPEYRKKHQERQKAWHKNKREKRRLISKMSSWRTHGRSADSVLDSESYRGRKWEYYALAVLPGSIDKNADSWGSPYDILWRDKTVDVKSAVLSERKNFWSFSTMNKIKPDYFFFVCVKNDEPYKVYLIPSDNIDTGISIGHYSSKYDEFLIYPKFILPQKI